MCNFSSAINIIIYPASELIGTDARCRVAHAYLDTVGSIVITSIKNTRSINLPSKPTESPITIVIVVRVIFLLVYGGFFVLWCGVLRTHYPTLISPDNILTVFTVFWIFFQLFFGKKICEINLIAGANYESKIFLNLFCCLLSLQHT